MNTEEKETTEYTVIAYWEEYEDRDGHGTQSKFTENHYDTFEEAINASIAAQVNDVDIVRIFRGHDIEDEIGDYEDIRNRVKAGREAKESEEKTRRIREIAKENERLKTMQEKYERLQLQKLLEKYPDVKQTGEP